MAGYAGSIRSLHTGVLRGQDSDGALDAAGTPAEPIATNLPGATGIPWWDGYEDLTAVPGLPVSADPSHPVPNIGERPIMGAYEGSFRTRGPVVPWGYEATGGLGGDQALGRTLHFGSAHVDRYDVTGVRDNNYSDELAAAIANNGHGQVSEAEYTTSLLLYR